MINGIFVPAGNLQGSEIIPFAARVAADGEHPNDGQIHTRNFDAHATMQASLRIARQACEDRLTTLSGIWDAILLPALASPFSLNWRLVAVIGFLSSALVSLGAGLWLILATNPPVWLQLAWIPFLVTSVVLLSAALLSLPLRLIAQWFRISQQQYLQELRDFLQLRSFEVWVENGVHSGRIFTGPSAGLTLFCALVHAVKTSGKQSIILPWQENLVAIMSGTVSSVDLRSDGRFARLGNAPEFPYKIAAIWDHVGKHPNSLRLAVFSTEDFGDVRREWYQQAAETLQPNPGGNDDYFTAYSYRGKLTFLFCDSLRAFLHYLHPWQWRWLVSRAALLSLAPVLAVPIIVAGVSINSYSPPEVEIVCVPACKFADQGIYTASVPASRVSMIQTRILSPGAAGGLTLDVESTHDKTVIPTIGGEPQQGFSISVTQDSELFFVTIPRDRSPEAVVVVVTLANAVNKSAQASFFFTP